MNIQTDPRFRLPSRKDTHVRLDSRFAHMLRSDDFSSKAKVDRYGRRLPKNAGEKGLENYYRLEDESNENDEVEGDDEVERELNRVRMEDEEIGSSSDEESEEAEEEEDGALEEMFKRDADEAPLGEVTSRIAVVNIDWDNIRSTDLLAVFSSFVPSGGRILKVSIYPSDFGKERMKREEMEGPPKEIFGGNSQDQGHKKDNSDNEESEGESFNQEDEDERIKRSLLKEDQGDEFNSASLRRYQLSRLRYYYAVLICSTPSVAEAIYNAVDGTEYLTTANFFDLRFVPDDVDFDTVKPRDECDRVPDGYRPNEFITDALQHSKVRLTWDADDGSRKQAQKRAFSGSRAEIDENDLKAYLGSDSEEDDEAPEPVIIDATAAGNSPDEQNATESTTPQLSKKEAERQRMRSILGLHPEQVSKRKPKRASPTPVGDMQITFTSGLSNNRGSVFESQAEPDREETTVEKYIRKEKERKNRRKERIKLQKNPDAENSARPEAGDTLAEDADAGFDDPFFTEHAANPASLKKSRKQAPKPRSPSPETLAQRAQLSKLVAEDAAAGVDDINHFNSALLSKGESLSKKKRKHKLSERQKAALEAKEKDSFEINAKDPRFAAVFNRNDYAIDPSHKGYKGTEGMRRLLEEGRRKRGADGEVDQEEGGRNAKKGKRRKDGAEDVSDLVKRVRRREKTP